MPTPIETARTAVADPAAADLADPILRRDLQGLTLRLAHLRTRGGAYAAVEPSPELAGLLARLEAGATLTEGVH